MKVLNKNFYNRNTLIVARELLGKFIVRKIGKKKLVGKIVEVEAYHGPKDLASHASRGKTARNKVMFGCAGHAYVYMIYGMYYCFNIVTGDHGYPAAVLIRAVEWIPDQVGDDKKRKPPPPPPAVGGIKGGEKNLTNGPGKFCRAFKIDKKLNGVDITKRKILWVEDRGELKKAVVVADKRIGVDYAGKYKDKRWRFYIKSNECVSRK
ncbi:DNA-3-methyladenine glycosylase [Candidatus Falkowbacteria bacterium]|nr:DNA-3-methyladenine glycosylase [Candidatus Falkowbacteria bacterium]